MDFPRVHREAVGYLVVTYIFQTLADKAEQANVEDMSFAQARTWYRNQASTVRKVNNEQLIDPKNVRQSLNQNNIGQMFMFFYDPKHKQTLPYYDKFPLVFPVELYRDGFLGINLHYLPRKLRATLMDALYMTINNRKNDKTTRLRLSYEILSASARMRYFKPCLKRYLASHVQQKFLYIDPTNWDKALMLPTERFVKKTAMYVQTESARSIQRGRNV